MLGLIAVVATSTALAHPATPSSLRLDRGRNQVRMQLDVPQDQLQMVLDIEQARIDTYVLSHLQLRAHDVVLEPDVVSAAWTEIDGEPMWSMTLDYNSPDSTELTTLTLTDDVLLHQVRSHKTLVTVTDPWTWGPEAGPQLVDVVRWPAADVVISRERPSRLHLVAKAAQMGSEHVATGWDHLLFLATLLLVVPARAESGRWKAATDARRVAWQAVGLITAFTIGHGLTLGLAAADVVTVNRPIVELLVAASILLAAVHAITPLFRRAELWLAGGFGLIHGLAFSEVLHGLGSDPEALLLTLLGFDLGVEAVQLGLAAVLLPLLWVTRSRDAVIRTVVGGLAFLVATGWTLSRLSSLT